ncbi:MAG: hypothetical protein ABWK53_09110, partial [Anaerolineales bacterium]
SQNPDGPPTLLDRRDPFQSLLAQLLAIDGNDARIDDDYFRRIFERDLGDLSPSETIFETPLGGSDFNIPLPSTWQTKLFLIEVGTAQ